MKPKLNSLSCLLTLTLLLGALVIMLAAKPANLGSSSAWLTAQANLVKLDSPPKGHPTGDHDGGVWLFPAGGTPLPNEDDNGQPRPGDNTCGRPHSLLEIRLRRCGHTWGG